MSWKARFTVQDIGDGPAPIDVLAVAEAVEGDGDDAVLGSAELRLRVNADSTHYAVGGVIEVTADC